MSGKVLALSIIGAVLLCCILPVAGCVLLFMFTDVKMVFEPDPSPEVAVVACDINESDFISTATVRYEVTNPGDSEATYRFMIAVRDSAGREVGSTPDFVFNVEPGTTVVEEAEVWLDESGGATCHVEQFED